jgi:hypothetical protein
MSRTFGQRRSTSRNTSSKDVGTSLREQVAQAELAVSGLVIDRAPASGVPNAFVGAVPPGSVSRRAEPASSRHGRHQRPANAQKRPPTEAASGPLGADDPL